MNRKQYFPSVVYKCHFIIFRISLFGPFPFPLSQINSHSTKLLWKFKPLRHLSTQCIVNVCVSYNHTKYNDNQYLSQALLIIFFSQLFCPVLEKNYPNDISPNDVNSLLFISMFTIRNVFFIKSFPFQHRQLPI